MTQKLHFGLWLIECPFLGGSILVVNVLLFVGELGSPMSGDVLPSNHTFFVTSLCMSCDQTQPGFSSNNRLGLCAFRNRDETFTIHSLSV